MKKSPSMTKDQRVRMLARAFAEHAERMREKATASDRPQTTQNKRAAIMRRKTTPDPGRVKPKIPRIIAYDLETTNIQMGTPRPLYLTAYGETIALSVAIKSIEHLADVVLAQFLIPGHHGSRFVAHNGNKFDAYFIAAAILHEPDFLIKPYLAGDSNFRGMKVLNTKTGNSWEFLDSMSMTGVMRPLSDFLSVFAPDYAKLESPDWEHETFSHKNKSHVLYAERDSEGLYHALMRAQNVVFDVFGIGLQPTVGNLGIKLFMRHIPDDICVVRPPKTPLEIIQKYVMRGGYCHLHRPYRGPVWRYDINQAYAAAMREAFLPSGRCCISGKGKFKSKYSPNVPRCAMYRIRATHPHNTIPFYSIAIVDGKAKFSCSEIGETWLTSIETEQLESEGWHVEYLESYVWENTFQMSEYVNKLESLRHSGIGGVKGAQGEMCKSIGNNSYGKTLEQLRAYELCMCAEKPDGWGAYYGAESMLDHVWFRFTKDDKTRDYHQPQVGAFITAHVRMVLRRAILLAPDNFVYADTDGVSFDAPVPAIPIDAKKYGLWKIEAENEQYLFVDKKVYCSLDGATRHAKGMTLNKKEKGLIVPLLTVGHFAQWADGFPPVQKQIQRNSMLKTMRGFDMFRETTKRGSTKCAPPLSHSDDTPKSA